MQILKTTAFCVLLFSTSLLFAAEKKSHSHIKNLLLSWPQAPQEIGLFTTALKEASIVTLHIQLSKIQDQDLAWIKRHIAQTNHALKPKGKGEGGLGYGLIQATYDIAKETRAATMSPDASINVKLHSKQIIMSAFNVASVARKMARLCKKIKKSTSLPDVLSHIEQLETHASELFIGIDIDKDGEISAYHNEGGLNLARDQLTYMARAEGIIKTKKN